MLCRRSYENPPFEDMSLLSKFIIFEHEPYRTIKPGKMLSLLNKEPLPLGKLSIARDTMSKIARQLSRDTW